jgi:septal ring factor EnvC (AmiA/AmiB activator)
MKKSATIALVVLLMGSVGASVYLVLDQKTKQKQIANKDASIAKQDKSIADITGKYKELTNSLAQATQAVAKNEKDYSDLKSKNDLLQVKITSAESKLTTQADGSSEAADKLQEALNALKSEAVTNATQQAALEAENSSLKVQVTDHVKQLQNQSIALAKTEADLKPFEELGKTPEEILRGLMKRPVTISRLQPLPPRPANQAGKITQPIRTPKPAPLPQPPLAPKTKSIPKPEPEITPTPAPPATPIPQKQP